VRGPLVLGCLDPRFWVIALENVLPFVAHLTFSLVFFSGLPVLFGMPCFVSLGNSAKTDQIVVAATFGKYFFPSAIAMAQDLNLLTKLIPPLQWLLAMLAVVFENMRKGRVVQV